MPAVLCISFAFLAGGATPARASQSMASADGMENGKAFLHQIQERDSVLIADQLEYGFVLENVNAGTVLQMPDFSEGMTEGVEVVSPWKLDTVKVLKGKKKSPQLMNIKGSVIITSFEEGEYELPPITLLRSAPGGNTDTLMYEAPAKLSVRTMPVDTTDYKVHDIKGQIKYPVEFKEVAPYIAAILLLACIIALAVYLTRKYFSSKSHGSQSKEPAHIVALRKLDKYRGEAFWAPDKQKVFYSGVTDALREYMASRYGVQAMEKTTKEIFDELKSVDMPDGLYGDLKALFERSDYVKFAKYVADSQENAAAVPLAVRFVTMTYQEQLENEAEKAEVSEKKEEK